MNPRPVYESSEDLRREAGVIEKVSSAWGVKAVKLKPFYRFDVAFLDPVGEINGFGEIKVRDHEKSKWPTYMISAEKVWEAEKVRILDELPVYLIVQWTDCLGFHVIQGLSRYRLGIGGRTDRGDDRDVEPCYFIPIGLFNSVVPDER